MRIEEMLSAIRAGKKVCREAWDSAVYICWAENMPREYYMSESDSHYTGLLAKVNGTDYEYNMSGLEMMADDWELYNEPT